MMEFLPWTEQKSLDLVRDGKAADVVRAYEAGFRVHPYIVDALLCTADTERATYFMSKGIELARCMEYNAWDIAMKRQWVSVIRWLVEHGAHHCPYLNYYERYGLRGVEGLLAAGVPLNVSEYMFISQSNDANVELMVWFKQNGCDVNSNAQVKAVALSNASHGNRTTMTNFLLGKLTTKREA